jgi:CheY-like chemotaxis protein
MCAEYVFADRQRLQQILLNLLSNGVKYNRVGGTVAVSCEMRGATQLRIKVADTGYGISQEQLGHLFTPFERLGAERSEIEGTGIGLALSRQLAEAMGGTLDIESTVGQGSTFWVELPLVEAPIERYERLNILGTPEAHGGRLPADRRTVLYIEDNLANLTLIQRIVAERDGIEIIPAMQGRLGLELAREHKPAVVLLDLHLPDISGDEVLQRLRDDPVTSTIPVVIVSADATPGQVQRLLNAGALAYLTKPIDVGQLLQILDDHVLPKVPVTAVIDGSGGASET